MEANSTNADPVSKHLRVDLLLWQKQYEIKRKETPGSVISALTVTPTSIMLSGIMWDVDVNNAFTSG